MRTTYDFSVCPTCRGCGYVIIQKPAPLVYGDDRLVDFAIPCPDCNGGSANRIETAKKLSSIPESFYNKKYESFKWNIYRDEAGKEIDLSKYQKLVESFLNKYSDWKESGMGLYIFSKTKGSGKTLLSSCLCNELMELYQIRTKFVSATQLLDISQSGDKTSMDEYKREPIKLLCNCELLVIDDIGQKKSGYDWMNEILFRIIDDRMNKKLITIFTSNLEIEDLTLDDRIIERIKKISMVLRLPEFNVRSRESEEEKRKFLKDMGLLERG